MSLLLLLKTATVVNIPTDAPGCVAWHEACNEPTADGNTVEVLPGVGGMPWGAPQLTAAKKPTVQLLASGKRAYRFDNVDDTIATAAVLDTRPFTVMVAYAAKSTATTKRALSNGPAGQNWLIGQRSESGTAKYGFYDGSFIHGTALDVDVVHVHTIRQRASGTLADYRIDGVAQGTNGNANTPGTIWIGGVDAYSETANADIIGMCAYNVALSDADITSLETYWATGCGGVMTPATIHLTQEVIEAVHGGNSNIQVTQSVIEAVHGGSPFIQVTQNVIEAVHGANSNIQVTQFVIEVAIPVKKGPRFWGTVIYGS